MKLWKSFTHWLNGIEDEHEPIESLSLNQMDPPFVSLSQYLNYAGYEDGLFSLMDEDQKPLGCAFTIELNPLLGANDELIGKVGDLFSILPANTPCQLQLFGSPDLRHFFHAYRDIQGLRPDDDPRKPVFQALANKRMDFWQKGTQQLLIPGTAIRLRRMRLILTVNLNDTDFTTQASVSKALSLLDRMRAHLKSMGVFIKVWDADDLVKWCTLMLNPHRMFTNQDTEVEPQWDPHKLLKEQLIETRTVAKVLDTGTGIRFGAKATGDAVIAQAHGGRLPENINELPPTHLINSEWESPRCDALGKNCKVVATKCLEGPATKTINGVAVTKDCWREERTMQCNTQQDVSECQAYQDKSECRLKREQCVVEGPDGSCQITEKTFTCTESEAGTQEVSSCVDRDFAKTMSSMEMVRQMQRYYDPENQRFFNGEDSRCSIKLGGALDSVLGGNCCKTKGEPAKLKDHAIQMGTNMAATYLMSSVASHYTYTTMFVGPAARVLGASLSSAGGLVGTTKLSVMGFTASGAGGNLGLIVEFNPAGFAAAIAMHALSNWLKCDTQDMLTAMKNKAGLCHYVGSYCGSKRLKICVRSVKTHCCYVSKLAKMIAIGGKQQLKRGFGSAKSPNCEGFTAQELEQLDFSQIDMSEFYAELVAKMENATKQGNAAIERATQNIGNGANAPVRNYYETP